MNLRKLALPFLIILAFLETIWIFINLSLPQLVTWDEAGYIWLGYQINQVVRAGNWPQFFQLTRSQFFYPFFQSWFLGLVSLPFEYTVNHARLVSLMLLIPAVVLIWLIGKTLNRKNQIPGILSAGLFLASPLLIYYFSTAMKESLGLVLTLACLAIYIIARENNRRFFFFLAGGLSLLLILTKYNYGALVLTVIVLESLLWLVLDKGYRQKSYWFNNVLFFLPTVLGLTGWVFYPVNNFSWFFKILQNIVQYNFYDTTILGHLLYYPLELAFGYFFSWPVFLIFAFGFVWSIRSWRNFKIRLLSLLFLLNLFLAGIHMGNNQARYIFTSVPAFFLVGSWGISQFLSVLKRVFRNPLNLGLGLPFLAAGGLIILKDLLILPKIIKPTGSHQVGTAIFYETDYQNNWRFDFDRSHWPKIIPANPQRVEDLFDFIFDQVDWRKSISLVNPVNEIPTDLFNFYLAKKRALPTIPSSRDKFQEYFVVLEIKPGSIFDSLDYQKASGPGFAQAKYLALNSGFPVIKSQEFKDLGLKVIILGRL